VVSLLGFEFWVLSSGFRVHSSSSSDRFSITFLGIWRLELSPAPGSGGAGSNAFRGREVTPCRNARHRLNGSYVQNPRSGRQGVRTGRNRQIRKWISEGRANRDTMAAADGRLELEATRPIRRPRRSVRRATTDCERHPATAPPAPQRRQSPRFPLLRSIQPHHGPAPTRAPAQNRWSADRRSASWSRPDWGFCSG